MEIALAEALVAACRRQGVRVELEENYSAAWMRGSKTAGVVLVDGDLAQVVAAIIANPQLFVEADASKFPCADGLRVSQYRLSLILY